MSERNCIVQYVNLYTYYAACFIPLDQALTVSAGEWMWHFVCSLVSAPIDMVALSYEQRPEQLTDGRANEE
jgi:hypothetical protein